MPGRCCVPDCRSNYFASKDEKNYVTVFNFPKDEKRKQLWERILGENFKSNSCTRICVKHFSEDCKMSDKSNRILLSKNAVPTLFLSKEQLTSAFNFSRLTKNYKTIKDIRNYTVIITNECIFMYEMSFLVYPEVLYGIKIFQNLRFELFIKNTKVEHCELFNCSEKIQSIEDVSELLQSLKTRSVVGKLQYSIVRTMRKPRTARKITKDEPSEQE